MTVTQTMRGEFTRQSLPALVQYLAQCKLSGEFILQHQARTSIIYLDRGKLVDAVCEGKNGQEAFFEIMNYEQGTFTFQVGLSVFDSRIEASLEYLLLNVAYRQDVGKPSLDENTVLQMSNEMPDHLMLNPDETRITARINGQRNLGFIARVLGLDPDHVVQTVGHLIDRGVLEIKTNIESSQPETVADSNIHSELIHQVRTILTRLVGPMAEFKIRDALHEFGYSSFEELKARQVSGFLEALSNVILKHKKEQFLNLTKGLGDHHERH
jgi:hypothetical protein